MPFYFSNLILQFALLKKQKNLKRCYIKDKSTFLESLTLTARGQKNCRSSLKAFRSAKSYFLIKGT